MSKESQKIRFLAELARGAKVTEASKAAGINRRTLYDWRDADHNFREAWDETKEEYEQGRLAIYEAELYERALDRSDRESAKLLVFLIKRLDPAYRENYKTETTVRHEKVHEISFSDEEMDEAISILQNAKGRQ